MEYIERNGQLYIDYHRSKDAYTGTNWLRTLGASLYNICKRQNKDTQHYTMYLNHRIRNTLKHSTVNCTCCNKSIAYAVMYKAIGDCVYLCNGCNNVIMDVWYLERLASTRPELYLTMQALAVLNKDVRCLIIGIMYHTRPLFVGTHKYI